MPNDMQIVRFDGGRAEMAVSQAQFGRTGNKPNDFITADGSIDFWIVPEFTNKKTAAEYPSKPVRLKVGAQYGNHNGFGEKHIAEQRKKFLSDIGMSAERYVHSLLNSAYRIYAEGNGVLQVEAYGEPKGKVVVELRDEGDYYSVVTAYDAPKKHGSLIWSGRRPVVSFEQNAVSSKVRDSNESSPPLIGSLEKPSPLNGTQGFVNQDPALDALGANRNNQNTITANLTKQQAIDIISRDADGKRLLKNGKVKVLGSIDEAPAHVLEQAKRSEAASDTPTQAEIAQAQRDLDTQLAIADKLEAEYGYLPAPNGEKSNLNRLQWAQVRTPQFKEFYGDWEKEQRRNDPMARQSVESNARTKGASGSRGGSGLSGGVAPSSRVGGVLQLVREEVRLDTNREPKVYYHGTSDDVSAFDTSHKNRKDKDWLGH